MHVTAGAYVALFGAGIASFLAPCVLPLVPAYLGMVAGDAADEGTSVRGAALFVCGFASVFVALGALAGRVGAGLDDVGDVLRRGGGLVIIALGITLLLSRTGRGLRERRALHRVALTGHITRPIALGVAFGAAWTPCVGPLLGAALVTAARSADAWRGATLLFAYALGVGLPFVAASLTLSSSPALLRRVRRVSARLVPVSAATLIVLGGLLATGTYDNVVGQLARVAPGAA